MSCVNISDEFRGQPSPGGADQNAGEHHWGEEGSLGMFRRFLWPGSGRGRPGGDHRLLRGGPGGGDLGQLEDSENWAEPGTGGVGWKKLDIFISKLISLIN